MSASNLSVSPALPLPLFAWLSQRGFEPSEQGLSFLDNSDGYRSIISTRDIKLHQKQINGSPRNSPASTAAEQQGKKEGETRTVDSCSSSSYPLLSIPESILITPLKIINNSPLISLYFPTSIPISLSSFQVLCLYILHHRRRSLFISNQSSTSSSLHLSSISPYISTLPQFYTTPSWWQSNSLTHLQCSKTIEEVKKERRKVAGEVRKEWKELSQWMAKKDERWAREWSKLENTVNETDDLPLNMNQYTLPDHSLCCCSTSSTSTSICSLFTLGEYQWAHSTVTTRTVYLPPSTTSDTSSSDETKHNSKHLIHLTDGGTSILIPFFDMFNHSCLVSSIPSYDPERKLYNLFIYAKSLSSSSIITPSTIVVIPKGSEVYINYGSHDNLTLLTRYGFTMEENNDDRVQVSLILIEAFLQDWHGIREKARLILQKEWNQSNEKFNNDNIHPLLKCFCSEQPLSLLDPNFTRPVFSSPPLTPPTSQQVELLRQTGLFELASAAELFSRQSHTCAPRAKLSKGTSHRPPSRKSNATRRETTTDETNIVTLPLSPPSCADCISCSSKIQLSLSLDRCHVAWDLSTYLKIRTTSELSSLPRNTTPTSSSTKQLTEILLSDGELMHDHQQKYNRIFQELTRFIYARRFSTSLQEDVHNLSLLRKEQKSNMSFSEFFARDTGLVYRIAQKRILQSIFVHHHM